ncbi:Lrp/AsnC family leucine-responsive transcriptional regulator [Hoeflea marina]|uniref:Lrp/AsnC family leucine-responsive transcriptional regulator n=1 Tax=Hoeflea marina TaxID=274592 RepID=A0A317PLT9_9HYPH|nr:Lrp/AsnC family transcriptional regulator [Hoeflea marina]PWV99023.1 Lrp/AsnC family leucine-responsive transcriptional regulator [Hoeflea marina]
MPENIPIDAADRKLISLLQDDARRTIEALAQACGLSASATQRRLQRLRDSKVISGEIAVIDPKRLGTRITLLVELELERDRPELMPALQDWIAATDSVQQAWQITGRGDLLLVVVTRSIEEFDGLAERMMEDNRNIRKFTTSVALKTLKRGLRVPVGD